MLGGGGGEKRGLKESFVFHAIGRLAISHQISNGFKFGAFTGRFKSDSAASVAVKGLITAGLKVHQQSVPVKERTHTHLKRADYIIILTLN